MMAAIVDIELPDELLVYKKAIESTIKPYIEIKANPDNSLKFWQSKFSGFPYLPKDFQYPRDSKGQLMLLLAQINFSETPKLKPFPEEGILQFYISNESDVLGLDYEDLTKQKDFRVIYFPDVLEDENQLLVNFNLPPHSDIFPLKKACSLIFNLRYAPMPVVDYQFKSKILGQNVPKSTADLYSIMDQYKKIFKSSGHKIGGYPYFTQNDPRQNRNYEAEGYVLLFQMDTDGEADIMWGDMGVGNFFIREQDLQKRDFSRILYNWDCC